MTSTIKYAERIASKLNPSIFEEFSHLATRLNATNLGQGFPDWETPKFTKDFLVNAVTVKNENQYFRVAGHLNLVNAIADEYSPKLNRKIDPFKEVVVGNGATHVLMNVFASFINEGDETIMFEPAFESYIHQNELFGGKNRYFPLDPPKGDSKEWKIDFKALKKCFNNKTKLLVFNTPHNPVGKMATENDILELISILQEHPNCIVVADEVYEYCVFGGKKHLRIGAFPGMWDRTVSIYSAGKTFSCTGWRVGYGIGPEKLIKPMMAAQNWATFCTNRAAQVAIGDSMRYASSELYQGFKNYYDYYTDHFTKKKNQLMSILRKAPFDWKVLEPEGGFFIICDISNSHKDIPIKYFFAEGSSQDNNPIGKDLSAISQATYAPDLAFCRWLMFEYGVVAIPLSPFYDQANVSNKIDARGSSFIRFAICKSDATMEAVAERFHKKKNAIIKERVDETSKLN